MSILELNEVAGLTHGMPGAELVLPHDAPREVWLDARRSGLGGSDALACLGLSPYSSRYSVWAEKRGLLPEKDDSEAMLWGRLLEPVIAEEFIRRTGIDATPQGLMRSTARPWQLASVDRLTADGGVLEIKTTSMYGAEGWDDDQIADAAEAQLMHYLAVTGLSHGYAVVLIGGQRMEIRHVERNDRLIALMNEAEEELWDLVVSGDAPAIDGSEASMAALAHIYPHAMRASTDLDADTVAALHRYLNYNTQIRTLTEAKDTIRAQVCAVLGVVQAGTHDGREVVTWKNTGNFNADKFREDHPDLAAEHTRLVPALDTAALKAADPELYAKYRGRRFLPSKKGLL